ncbi:MAG: hypothetical protein R3C05_23425 [Pirellulaceae bacterium]
MFSSFHRTLPLVLVVLFAGNGCYCFPSVRYRNPHDPCYESACSCGRGDCLECQHRVERQKPVPWPLFHPVPTSPVYDSRFPASEMTQIPFTVEDQLPPLRDYVPKTEGPEINPPEVLEPSIPDESGDTI